MLAVESENLPLNLFRCASQDMKAGFFIALIFTRLFLYEKLLQKRLKGEDFIKIFISGGCKNGNSTLAQILCSLNPPPLYYIATMEPKDAEDGERIERHIKNREGMGFITCEVPRDVKRILDLDLSGSFLLDSVTALLENEMFSANINFMAAEKIAGELSSILMRIKNIVIVSDYIYSDANKFMDLTETYRKSLAKIDRLCARECEIVLEAVGGIFIAHKGGDLYDSYYRRSVSR
jgi:adenosylcobinamide kinase/adenosylcobinamide-phosphate guanylyltransferase